MLVMFPENFVLNISRMRKTCRELMGITTDVLCDCPSQENIYFREDPTFANKNE
jgi:hypothetical protein